MSASISLAKPATNGNSAILPGHQALSITPPSKPVIAAMTKCTAVQFLFHEGGYRRFVKLSPDGLKKLSAVDIEALAERAQELKSYLSPASKADILARILSLLSHYKGETHAPQIEQIIANDWAQDVGDYPLWAINEAARQWRRTQKFRPQISEFIERCESLIADARDELKAIMAILKAKQTN